MKKKYLQSIFILTFVVSIISCKKSWLDAKPQSSLVVPTSIQDYQAILDNSSNTNTTNGYVAFNDGQNSLSEIMSGDFFVSSSDWTSSPSLKEKNSYIWNSDIYGEAVSDIEWNVPYNRILTSNIVLEGVNTIKPETDVEQVAWNQVRGSALFFRAYSHYDIAQEFCKVYEEASAASDQGVPLRLSSNINTKSIRASVQQTYDQIISDLKDASDLLPVSAPDTKLYKLRPTKTAALAMLARTYLSMSKFDSALKYSNLCLQVYNKLIDYNAITGFIDQFNDEVIFQINRNGYDLLLYTKAVVDSGLYKLYDENDLRKSIFFMDVMGAGDNTFVGGYDGFIQFSGLATDEVYLIRAECKARAGLLTEAVQDINTLYQKRWKSSVAFVPYIATGINDVLSRVIEERRKELCFRCLRWTDLRRLNKDQRFATTLTRVINGKTYTLSPGDDKYVLPIPSSVITLAGIAQNPR